MNMTKIEWTSKTWNPITGCPGPKVSPGCENCYAERMVKTRFAGRFGYDADDPFGVHVHHERWLQPIKAKKPQTIFVCSMGDLFHPHVTDFTIAMAFAVMAMCPQHTFMILTKRQDRLESFLADRSSAASDMRGTAYQEVAWVAGVDRNMDALPWPLPNVLHGITVCTQQEADEKLIPFKPLYGVRYFLSLEPLLGPVKLEPRHGVGGCMGSPVKLVIVGGETGPNARPMHPDWVRGVRDACAEWAVPFFFKGWGEWQPREWKYDGATHAVRYDNGILHTFAHSPTSQDRAEQASEGWHALAKVGKKNAGRLLDGREWNEVPK